MTFEDGKMPVSTDVVELFIHGDKVCLYCLVCGEDIGDADYLNQAILLWMNHQAEQTVHQ